MTTEISRGWAINTDFATRRHVFINWAPFTLGIGSTVLFVLFTLGTFPRVYEIQILCTLCALFFTTAGAFFYRGVRLDLLYSCAVAAIWAFYGTVALMFSILYFI